MDVEAGDGGAQARAFDALNICGWHSVGANKDGARNARRNVLLANMLAASWLERNLRERGTQAEVLDF